ncbi:hypothetical protein Dsin_011910 [Dipteronia sinensis]|uniref:Uncharacterized protein n=1 Tax=Dipteronia sinensis TaxID=43782 RepID=A0AAE0AHN7_9ROSI|nr:hypothetical protein Dsin_011910 [Dipteronia sinensis]
MSGDRAIWNPHRGAVAIYDTMLTSGVTLPLQPFIARFLAEVGIAPAQLSPNSYRVLISLWHMWKQIGAKHPPPPDPPRNCNFYTLGRSNNGVYEVDIVVGEPAEKAKNVDLIVFTDSDFDEGQTILEESSANPAPDAENNLADQRAGPSGYTNQKQTAATPTVTTPEATFHVPCSIPTDQQPQGPEVTVLLATVGTRGSGEVSVDPLDMLKTMSAVRGYVGDGYWTDFWNASNPERVRKERGISAKGIDAGPLPVVDYSPFMADDLEDDICWPNFGDLTKGYEDENNPLTTPVLVVHRVLLEPDLVLSFFSYQSHIL